MWKSLSHLSQQYQRTLQSEENVYGIEIASQSFNEFDLGHQIVETVHMSSHRPDT